MVIFYIISLVKRKDKMDQTGPAAVILNYVHRMMYLKPEILKLLQKSILFSIFNF